MPLRTFVTIVSFGALAVLHSTVSAQGTKSSTLDEILQRLNANLNRYDSRIPSLFCDEHVLSQVEAAGARNQAMVTDSIYRIKRTVNSDRTVSLVESRDIKKVDGRPATSQELEGPSLLSGWFEAGLALVSQGQSVCTNYSLEKINRTRSGEPYVVRFATVLTPQNSEACLLQEESTGRAFIDRETMQIKRVELTTPHHAIIARGRSASPIVGKRVLSIDYAPVELGGETFWMPSRIAMHATSGSGTFHMIVWSFQGSYSNYHKLQVTSHIVPMPD